MDGPINWSELAPPVAFMVAMLVLFWFMIIKPTKTRQKKHVQLIQSLSVGDEVVTVGGIYGKVTKVGEDSVDLQVTANVTLKLDRRAIRRRRGEKDNY